jgi:Circadian oscillating protein COP23
MPQMNRLLSWFSIALFLPILIFPSPSLANKKDNIQFFCGRVNQDGKIIPTTQVIATGNSEAVSLILWKYTPPKRMTNQQRCETVSKRFQSAWNKGNFDKLIAGIDKASGLGLICAVRSTERTCDRSNLLFSLNTGSDAEDMLNRIRGTLSNPDKGSPIPQSSGENEIDMQLFIDRLKNK